jgi:hypothetical protein
MGEDRSPVGGRKAADHRGGDLPALKDFFGLERHRAKTLGGLLTRLAAKIAAYTCAQRMNDSLGPYVAWRTC